MYRHLALCRIVCIFILDKNWNICQHFPAFSFLFTTTSVQIFALVLSQSHLSLQDDSDDEPSTAKRAHGHGDGLEFMDLSCEEGEETASSEVHSEV